MEVPVKFNEGVTSWETVIFLYNSALKEVGTKVDILNDEFRHVNPGLSPQRVLLRS